MIAEIYRLLKQYEHDPKVTLVMVVSVTGGKAFCAGGDIMQFTSEQSMGHRFAKLEYKMDHLIHTYSKPYLSVVDGVAMGGGVGLCIHGQYRIFTENALWAMPENRIAYIPDVGTNFFTSRIGAVGMYLVLTGTRIGARDAMTFGLASHFVQHADVQRLVEDLCHNEIDTQRQIEFIINKFRKIVGPELSGVSLRPSVIEPYRQSIERCFNRSAESVEEICRHLEAESVIDAEWSKKTLEQITTASPLSVKASFKLLKMAVDMDIDDILRTELRIGTRLTQQGANMVAGVRAALKSKGQVPEWNPPTLAATTPDMVDKLFERMSPDQELDI
eukprot:gene4348-5077_t